MLVGRRMACPLLAGLSPCLARPSRSHHPQVELLSRSAVPTEKPQTTLHGGQTVALSEAPLVSSAVVCAFWNLGAGTFLQLRTPPLPHRHTHIWPSAGAFFLCKQSPWPLLCLTVFSLCSHLGSGRVIVSATSAHHTLGEGGICEDWDSQ